MHSHASKNPSTLPISQNLCWKGSANPNMPLPLKGSREEMGKYLESNMACVCRSFGRGLVFALPGSILVWALAVWVVV
jgi:hypothetical protein